MSVDKLVDSTQLDSDLTSVANAIRTKGGTSASLAFPSDFVTAIGNISGGGGYTAADFIDVTKPVGDFVSDAAYIGTQNSSGSPCFLAYRTNITKVYMPNYNNKANASTGPFNRMSAVKYFILPKMTKAYNTAFYSCSELLGIDWLGGEINGSSNQFASCSKLNIMVIRKTDAVCSLSTINAFNSTPFASNGAGGTLYVPQSLISTYQSATNWSTILGYANNSIKSIESTATDPDAPVDLTTHYIDGTLIPT